jgi:hypothetical protein
METKSMNYNPYAAGPNETLSNELDRDTIHRIGLMKCKATGTTIPNFTIFGWDSNHQSVWVVFGWFLIVLLAL